MNRKLQEPDRRWVGMEILLFTVLLRCLAKEVPRSSVHDRNLYRQGSPHLSPQCVGELLRRTHCWVVTNADCPPCSETMCGSVGQALVAGYPPPGPEP